MKHALSLVIACLATVAMGAQAQTARMVTFDQDKVGAPPSGFSTALTGQGKPGVWVVVKDPSPERGNVLAQTDADPPDYRFPVCVLDDVSAKDLDLSVMAKPMTGRGDQAAGLVWRYQDHNNYYIVRANALEHNVVLYKVQNGRRTDLPLKGVGRTYGKKVTVPSGQWSTLRVTAAGALFTVYFNNEKLFEVEDTTFPGAGKVGVWTKADSVTHFDNLSVSPKWADGRRRLGAPHGVGDDPARAKGAGGRLARGLHLLPARHGPHDVGLSARPGDTARADLHADGKRGR